MSRRVLGFDKGLYGLRSSGARFHEHLRDMLRKMDFKLPKQTKAYGSRIAMDNMSILSGMRITF